MLLQSARMTRPSILHCVQFSSKSTLSTLRHSFLDQVLYRMSSLDTHLLHVCIASLDVHFSYHLTIFSEFLTLELTLSFPASGVSDQWRYRKAAGSIRPMRNFFARTFSLPGRVWTRLASVEAVEGDGRVCQMRCQGRCQGRCQWRCQRRCQ